MSSDYDATEFVDGDLEAQRPGSAAPVDAGTGSRAPTREEVDSKVAETQRKLAELKRAQEERERELAGLEETRRRQIELRTGRGARAPFLSPIRHPGGNHLRSGRDPDSGSGRYSDPWRRGAVGPPRAGGGHGYARGRDRDH